MKAILLARVSTEEQKEAGNSLPAQVFRLEKYIERNEKLTLEKEFTFDESAYKEDRAKFDDVIKFIEGQKEIAALCCDKVDRLARDFLVGLPKIEKLRREGKIELHFPGDNLVLHKDSPATDLFHFNIAVSLSQYYSNAISDNVKRALEQKLRSGEWTGQPHIGYINTLENEKKGFALDPERAYLVRKIFELYATGNYSVKTLRDEITKLGLRSRNGKVLSPSMVHKILKDKFYIGIMTSKGREYTHNYPTIVPKDVFERVQGILASFQKKTVKYAAKPFVFRGMVHCDKCGGTITAELKKGRYVYYSCSNFKGKCERVWVREEELLEPIKDVLRNIQMPQEKVDKVVASLKALNESKNLFHQNQLDQLQKEYNRLQRSIDRLLDLFVDASITRDEYDKKLKDYKEKQHDAAIRLEELTNADENYHITATTLFSLANRALEIFESSEVNEKRQLLNFLLQNCRLSGKNLAFELRSPFGMMLEYAHHPSVLPLVDELRTLNWKEIALNLRLLTNSSFATLGPNLL